MTARTPRIIVVLLIGIVWAAIAADTVARNRVGLQWSGEVVVRIQDFASHLEFTRAVLDGTIPAGEEPSVFSPGAHLQFMERWAGSPQQYALPFGYSPTMLWVLGALVMVPLPVAYLLWTAIGYCVVAALILKSRVPPLGSMFFFLSPVAAASVALGQTAVLGTVGLLFLALASTAEDVSAESWRAALPSAVVLWALSAKPPVALAAAAGVLGAGRYRVVLLASAMTFATATLLTPFMGIRWPVDYLVLLGSYDRAQVGPEFAWSLVPDLMSNLRAFLHVDLSVPDPLAARVANLGLLLALAGSVVAGRFGGVPVALVWCFSVLAYLLLASHVSFTEELALLVIPVVVRSQALRTTASDHYGIWALAVGAILVSPAIGPAAGIRPAIPFFLKVAMLAWIVWLTWVSRRYRPAKRAEGCAA